MPGSFELWHVADLLIILPEYFHFSNGHNDSWTEWRCSEMKCVRCLFQCLANPKRSVHASHYYMGIQGSIQAGMWGDTAGPLSFWPSLPRVTSLQGLFRSHRSSLPGGQRRRSRPSAISCRFWIATGTTQSPYNCFWPRSCALKGQRGAHLWPLGLGGTGLGRKSLTEKVWQVLSPLLKSISNEVFCQFSWVLTVMVTAQLILFTY